MANTAEVNAVTRTSGTADFQICCSFDLKLHVGSKRSYSIKVTIETGEVAHHGTPFLALDRSFAALVSEVSVADKPTLGQTQLSRNY